MFVPDFSSGNTADFCHRFCVAGFVLPENDCRMGIIGKSEEGDVAVQNQRNYYANLR